MLNALVLGIKHNRGFLLLMLLFFASRSSFADWYVVPSGSMQPNILVGDRIFVNKMAYTLELPFTDFVLATTGQPSRGDIVVFKSKQADERLVKRVIGLPGDTVSMHNNRLSINGQPSVYQVLPEPGRQREQTASHSRTIEINPVADALHSFDAVQVPDGQYLVLGDNRNNSADSRYIGFVPLAELQGQAIGVISSFDQQNYYLPRNERWFSALL